MNKNVSTESYKGVRDFYPEDMFIQNHIFEIWKKTLKSFGYEQYDASILESLDLYKLKSGEEIINNQTYSFIDRGDREVALRPEMTPTIARMIAKKQKELVFPLRWFSIPNLFRYERPQRGRLREHWQLNADIFGVSSIEAEVEMIEIATTLMRNFGLNDNQYEIRINNRQIMNRVFEEQGLDSIQKHQISKLLDKKDKIDTFESDAEKIIGRPYDFNFEIDETVQTIIDKLAERQITNVKFSPELMRGFDYYTGVVFEIFDLNPENNRSLFGGGRFDELLAIFGQENVPAVGFGMGDVTIRDVLEGYGLLPEYTSSTEIYICPLNDAFYNHATEFAQKLREGGLNVSIDYSGKKIGDQIKKADKMKIPFVVCIGEDEVSSETYFVKELSSGNETKLKISEIVGFVKKS